MRIAMVSEHATPVSGRDPAGPSGGPAWPAAELATALARAGHEVRFYARPDAPDQPERVPLAPGVTLVHVPAGPAAPAGEERLLRHAKQFGERLAALWSGRDGQSGREGWVPDLIHAHYWLSGLAGLVAARATRVPLVLSYQEIGSRRRRYLGDADTSPSSRVGFERELGRNADRVIAQCRAESSELIRLGVPRSRITVVPLGVDPDRFAPTGSFAPPRGSPAQIVMVGSAGELREREGYEDAIAALPKVPDAELVVVGGPGNGELGRDERARTLRAVAERYGVGHRLRLVGRVPRDEVPKWYRAADLVACASWYDSFGITAVEAMAAGRPVVATEVGGFTDTVVDGLTGMLVPPRQPAALARAFRTVLSDPIRRVEYAAAGLDRVRQCYSWDRVATRTLAEYEQVCRH